MGQEEAGGMLDFPALQLTQETRSAWREAVAASSVMYFPDGQFVQLIEAVDEYVPKEQMTQEEAVVASFAIFPASQSMQAVSSAWRAAVMESSIMYFPEGQVVQVEPNEENLP